MLDRRRWLDQSQTVRHDGHQTPPVGQFVTVHDGLVCGNDDPLMTEAAPESRVAHIAHLDDPVAATVHDLMADDLTGVPGVDGQEVGHPMTGRGYVFGADVAEVVTGVSAAQKFDCLILSSHSIVSPSTAEPGL